MISHMQTNKEKKNHGLSFLMTRYATENKQKWLQVLSQILFMIGMSCNNNRTTLDLNTVRSTYSGLFPYEWCQHYLISLS